MANSSEKENIGAKKGADQAKQNQSISVEVAPISGSVNAPVSGQLQLAAPNEQSGGHDYFFQNPEWWLVIWTMVLVAVTWRLAHFTKKLWNSTVDLASEAKSTSERQAGEMKESLALTKQSADAATVSAAAAKATADAIPNAERAYVFVFVLSGGPLIADREPLNEVWISHHNHGRTPAMIGRVRYGIQTFDGYPKRGEGFISDTIRPDSANVLPAGAGDKPGERVHGILGGYALPSEAFSLINERRIRLLCFGVLEYEDVFGRQHETGWCWEYDPQVQAFRPSDCKELNYRT
jgi:hypothetical protein